MERAGCGRSPAKGGGGLLYAGAGHVGRGCWAQPGTRSQSHPFRAHAARRAAESGGVPGGRKGHRPALQGGPGGGQPAHPDGPSQVCRLGPVSMGGDARLSSHGHPTRRLCWGMWSDPNCQAFAAQASVHLGKQVQVISMAQSPHHPARLVDQPPPPPPFFSVWNSTFLGRPGVAVLPYAQALAKFPAHIQQVCGLPCADLFGLRAGVGSWSVARVWTQSRCLYPCHRTRAGFEAPRQAVRGPPIRTPLLKTPIPCRCPWRAWASR